MLTIITSFKGGLIIYPFLNFGSIALPTFALTMLLALLVSMTALILYKKSSMQLRRRLLNFMPWILVAAGVAGRLLSAIILTVKTDNSFWYNVIYGGCVYYGAVAGGAFTGYLLCRRYKLDFLSAADVSMTVLPLAQAVGRFGCWLNGCCYGKISESVMAVPYVVDGQMVRVLPTWFFESAVCFALWLVIYLMKPQKRGVPTGLYCICYGISRFIIEFFRGDAVRGIFGSLSTSQYISVPLVIVGAAILISAYLNKKENIYIY